MYGLAASSRGGVHALSQISWRTLIGFVRKSAITEKVPGSATTPFPSQMFLHLTDKIIFIFYQGCGYFPHVLSWQEISGQREEGSNLTRHTALPNERRVPDCCPFGRFDAVRPSSLEAKEPMSSTIYTHLHIVSSFVHQSSRFVQFYRTL